MASQLQLRRGTAAEIAAFTGVEGEVTPDMTNNRLVLHDGTTAGGHPVASEAYVNSAITGLPGTGDVVGPASASAASVAGFDGTTGKLIQELTPTEVRTAAGATATGAALLTATDDSTAREAISADTLPGHIWGLTLSNNGTDATNDIDIALGSAADSTGAYRLVLASGITKRLDASWAVGTGNGGLDTGSIANATYHVFLIKRSDTSVVDVLFSTSASSPTMPTNYDRKRRIGSIIRASSSIVAFSQNGDEFLLKTRSQDVVTGTVTSATAASIALASPAGIKVNALCTLRLDYSSVATSTLLSSLDETDQAPAGQIQTITVTSTVTPASSNVSVRTNTSSQIRIRSSGTGATVGLNTYGWIDRRGRDG